MSKQKKQVVTSDVNLAEVQLGQHVKNCMSIYGKHVIEDRAVPDFRDGSKPSQRRVMVSMRDLGITYNGSPKKCARIVGHCLGLYHPHSDSAVYGTLVGLTKSRYPLIDSCKMNFGGMLAQDVYGSMRYTEARVHKLSEEHFSCLAVAETMQNFSGETTEPLVINTRLPILMMNGADGIAVGMSTAIPSHNLEELVEALVFTAKHMKTVKPDDLMQFIKGPDESHGGILLSKPKDLLELYSTGYGRLDFMCEYTLNKTDTHTDITVNRFPDAFKIDAFLEKCIAWQESKIIKRVETHYINKDANQIILVISVDNKTAMEKVVDALKCSASYQFNVTERISEEDIELKHMNLVSWAKAWIRWRKQEEQKMLLLHLDKLQADLRREKLRLKGIVNIDMVIAAIKQDRVEPAQYLAEKLKITLDDAQFIGAIPVFQLKKADIGEQKQKIQKISDSMVPVRDDLENLTRVVIQHLRALKPYFDERRTRVGARGPQLSRFETTGDPVIVAASTDGKLFSHLDEKSTTTADLFATGTFSGAVLFARNGMVCYLSPQEMTGKAGPAYSDTVGIAQQELQYILGIGANGMCVRLPMQQRRSEFPLIRDTELIYGCGLNPDSKLLVWGSKGEFQVLRADQIKEVTRANVAGVKLVPFKPVRALVVHAGQALFDLEGSNVAITRAGDVESVVTIDSRNVVFFKSGRRKILDSNGAKKALSANDVKSVFPVTVPQ